jgi:hypothetical protein
MDLTIFFTSESIFVEPFVGKKHLIEYLFSLDLPRENYSLETYDIDPKNCTSSESNGFQCHPIQRDTIMNPPEYKNKIVLTNPPYLAKNKSKDKKYFDKYDQNDLYKCFIETLIQDPPLGGLIIIPLNFWCSITKSDIKLRKRFIEKFETVRVNVFEESVFQDTSYTVCSILFKRSSAASATTGSATTGSATTGSATTGSTTGSATTGSATTGSATTGSATTVLLLLLPLISFHFIFIQTRRNYYLNSKRRTIGLLVEKFIIFTPLHKENIKFSILIIKMLKNIVWKTIYKKINGLDVLVVLA